MYPDQWLAEKDEHIDALAAEVAALQAKLDRVERGVRSVIEHADDLGVPGVKFTLRRILDDGETEA